MALLPLVKGRKGLLLELLHLEEGWDRAAVGAPSPWEGWDGQQLVLHPLEGALGGLERGLMWNSRPLGRVRGGAYTSSGNSVGVAIPQPRVAGEARYPGYLPHQPCNAVSVALSRRRYPQRDFHGFGTFDNFPLRVTPTANRNSFRVALSFIIVPRVEALRTSTLGYEIATPTELPRVRTIHSPHPTDNHKPRPTNPSHPTDNHAPRPTNPSHPTDNHKPRPTNPSHTTDNHTSRPTNPSDTTDNHSPRLPISVPPVTIATIILMTSAKIMTISTKFLMTYTNLLTISATLEATSTNFLTNSAGSYRPKRVYVLSETCVRAV